MEPLTYQSTLISRDEAAETGCFTTLPIRIHAHDNLANDASKRFMRDWSREMGDGRETRTYFSFSPVGNWSSLIYPEAIPERLGVLAYLSDLGLIHDDAGEELTIEEAEKSNSELHAALNPETNSDSAANSLQPESRAAKTKKLVTQCMLECVNLDRDLGLAMLAAFRDVWLAVSEKHGEKQAESVEEYLEHRSDNGGMLVFWPMLQFSQGLHISTAEHTLVQPLIDAATRGLLLANDYFSWERESRELQSGQTQRIVSAVELFIRTQGLSVDAAKAEVKRMIIESESEFCRLRDELYKTDQTVTLKLRRWIDCVGLSVSGNHYWCSACPRQNSWKNQPEPQSQSQTTKDAKSHEGSNLAKEKSKELSSSQASTSSSSASRPHSTSNSVDFCSVTSDGTASSSLSRYPLQPASSMALDAPLRYIAGMPSKGVRSVLIDALNTWLKTPSAATATIMSVVNSLHTASLILDDLQDNSPLRRGLPSVHMIFGVPQAVNSADVMLVRALREAATSLRPASQLAVLEELENLHRGQSLELAWKHNLEYPCEGDYLNMVDHKTGAMFRMLARAMVAETDSNSSKSLDAAALEPLMVLFGRFFQVRDDYMNFGDYAAQKGFCEDLDEGKFSYPVVHCLANSPEYRNHILGIFRQRPTAATIVTAPLAKETKLHLLHCLVKSGSLDRTLEVMHELERDLEREIDKLEELSGITNPMLRICLVKLSTKDIARVQV